MRVLHVQKVRGIGGSERHLLSLLPKLAASGVEVRMCVAANGQAGEFTEALRERGVDHSVVGAGPDASPRLVGAIGREIRGFRPDLVHTHLIHADTHGQLSARLARVPSVSSIHSTHGFYGREPFRSVARLAGHSARLTIAISDHVRRYVEGLRIARRGAIRTIPYGIEASAWLSTTAERDAARANLEVRDSDVVVGVASRLVPHKGHSFVLRGHSKAVRKAPQLRLLIAGDGPLRSDLEREAQGLDGSVRFLGFVERVREFMAACDVLVFPSQPEFGEGFGLAALEAMAAGRPVVATEVCSLPEVVGSGEAGVLVAPDNSDELAAALVRLAENPETRKDIGARAHDRAQTTFSLDAMVERTLAAYHEAL